MAANTTIRVPKEAGDEIRIRRGGGETKTYKVHDGHVSVPNADAKHFVRVVSGAQIVHNSDKKETA